MITNSRYASVSDMLGVLGWTPLSQRRLDLYCFTKLLTVWHKCPSKAYKGTRRKHNMKWTVVFPKTISAWNGLAFAEAPSLAVFRSNFIKN